MYIISNKQFFPLQYLNCSHATGRTGPCLFYLFLSCESSCLHLCLFSFAYFFVLSSVLFPYSSMLKLLKLQDNNVSKFASVYVRGEENSYRVGWVSYLMDNIICVKEKSISLRMLF